MAPSSGVYRTTADDQGNWQIDLDTDKTISGGIVLDNGETITATANAEDQDRNVSDNSALSFFTIDTVPPGSVQINSPADNSTIVDPDTITDSDFEITDSDFEISGTADAETEIRVTLVESDTNERVTYIITSDAIGGWKINLGGDDEPDFGLDEGEGFEIYATAYDLAGNESPTATSSFNISTLDDNGTPQILVPENGDFSDNTPVISGIARPGEDVTVTLTDAEGQKLTEVVTADENGSWSLNVATPETTDPDTEFDLEHGQVISVSAKANGHNTSGLSATPDPLEFTIDSVLPDIPIINDPRDGADLNEAPEQISGSVTDDASTVRVVLTDEENNSVTYRTEVNSQGNWKIDFATDLPEDDPNSGNPVEPLVFDEDGAFQVQANAIDQAGNFSLAATSSFDVDQTNPDAPVITSPQDDTYSVEEFTVEGTSSEEGGEVKLTVSDDQGNIKVYSTTVINGKWSVDVESQDVGGIPGAGEDVTLTATVIDEAGNVSDPSATHRLDIVESLTTPVILSPENDGTIGESTVISGTGTPFINEVMLVLEDPDGNKWTYYADVNLEDESYYWEVDLATAVVEGTTSFDGGERITVTAYNVDIGETTNPDDYDRIEVETDLEAPFPPIIEEPGYGAGVNGTELPDIEGTSEPDSLVELVLTDTVEQISSTFYVTADAGGDWSLDSSSVELDFDLNDDDDLTITAIAIDPANNRSDPASQPLYVRLVENGVPELSYPEDNSFLSDDQLFPTLHGVADPGATVYVTVNDGSDDSIVYIVTANSSGQWTVDMSEAIGTGSFDGFEDGDNVSVTLQANNGDGNLIDGKQDYSFTVDITEPDPPDILTPSNDYYSHEAGITGSSEAYATLLVTLSDGEYFATYSVQADASGNWSLNATVDAYEGTLDLETGETVTVQASATDRAGNISGYDEESYTVDLIPPYDPVLDRPDGTIGIAAPVLYGTGDPESTVVIILYDDDGEGPVTYEVVPEADGTWSFDLSQEPTFDFVDDGDRIAVDLYAYDIAGNTSETYFGGYIYSYDASLLSISYPADGSFVPDEDGDGKVPTYVTGVADEGETVTLVITDGTFTGTYQVVADENRKWVFDISDPDNFVLVDGGGPTFDDGETITVTAAIETSNGTLETVSVFTIDMTPPPEPVITSPAQDDWIPDLTPSIEGTAEPEGFVILVLHDVDDDETVTVTTSVDVNGNWSINTEGTAAYDLFEDGDLVEVTATAMDRAGNQSGTSDNVSFTLSHFTPGQPTIIEPSGDFDDETPYLSGLGDPGREVTIWLEDNDGDRATYVVTAANNGRWELDFDPAANPDDYRVSSSRISIDEGDVVTATAVIANDTGGVNASDPKVFTVDTTGPDAPTIDEPVAGDVSDQDPVLGTGSEEGSIIRLTVSEGDAQAIFTAEVVGGNWAIDIWSEEPVSGDTSFLEDGGDVTLEARAYDAAGNESEPTIVDVSYDTDVPEKPTIAEPTDGDVIATDEPILSGTAVGSDYVEIILDDSPDGKSTYTVDVTDGTWILDFTDLPTSLSGDPFTVDDDDPVRVEVVGYDSSSGNGSEASDVVIFTYDIDLDVPAYITSPADGTVIDPNRDGLLVEGTGPAGGTIVLEVWDGTGFADDDYD